jgi:ATP/ADP translocase
MAGQPTVFGIVFERSKRRGRFSPPSNSTVKANMSRSTAFSLLPIGITVSCLVIAAVVPRKFEGLGWQWILVLPAIVLGFITAIFFAFTFMPSKIAMNALCVSRFPRLAALAMTTGSGYMAAWLAHGASLNGWDTKLTCLPGIVLLTAAWVVFSRFRCDVNTGDNGTSRHPR